MFVGGHALAATHASFGEGFASQDAALKALIGAMRTDDTAAEVKILGPESKNLVSSGDSVADKAVKTRIVSAYDQMHRFANGPDRRIFVYLGADNWPMPIPLVKRGSKWYFDTAYGKGEIMARRIGRNELDAIQVCRAIVDAEHHYASQVQTGEDGKQYAQRFLSEEGKHNGLFWKAAAGEPPSPLGPLIVSASAEGYDHARGGKREPYHGYFFRILTEQGEHAPGGTHSYLQDGKMTGGFAVLAYPASYRGSGVMTFLAGQDGTVYQKGSGTQTTEISPTIKSYDPDSSWQPVPQEDEEESAGSDPS
jgi:Protein of unknown function (DUF2950)